MDGGTPALGNENLDLLPKLYERLRQIAGYTWDESRAPIHSSYDNWYLNTLNYRLSIVADNSPGLSSVLRIPPAMGRPPPRDLPLHATPPTILRIRDGQRVRVEVSLAYRRTETQNNIKWKSSHASRRMSCESKEHFQFARTLRDRLILTETTLHDQSTL